MPSASFSGRCAMSSKRGITRLSTGTSHERRNSRPAGTTAEMSRHAAAAASAIHTQVGGRSDPLPLVPARAANVSSMTACATNATT
jgi:hypothetical protein